MSIQREIEDLEYERWMLKKQIMELEDDLWLLEQGNKKLDDDELWCQIQEEIRKNNILPKPEPPKLPKPTKPEPPKLPKPTKPEPPKLPKPTKPEKEKEEYPIKFSGETYCRWITNEKPKKRLGTNPRKFEKTWEDPGVFEKYYFYWTGGWKNKKGQADIYCGNGPRKLKRLEL